MRRTIGNMPRIIYIRHTAVLWAAILLLIPALCTAADFSYLQPDDVAVVVNTRNSQSKTLALYYMQKRYIPWKNLITIETVTGESCSRREYEKSIAGPVKKALQKLQTEKLKIRCLVCMYGIPLRIRQVRNYPEDSSRLKKLKEKKQQLTAARRAAGPAGRPAEEQKKITAELRGIQQEINTLNRQNTKAAVDSELSLVMEDGYPLAGWIPNPLFQPYRGTEIFSARGENIIMVSRLDGPDPATVRRIIDDSAAAEKKGLRGIAYFDARWKEPIRKKGLSGYAQYDAAIHHAALLVDKSRRMQVVKESSQSLFLPGQCPRAALYCGWYSLARYIDAFQWQQGAIGYHIASSECTTLKKKGSQVWCKRMLEEGIAVTVGPVYEPYVQAFPFPDMFFASLLYTGSSIAEAYYYSLPFVSWQMVLIADPLYRPFRKFRLN